MTDIAALVPNTPLDRFDGIERPYDAADVARLRGSLPVRHTLAERGAARFWALLREEPYIHALGALSGGQAVQMVRAGLKAIYLSGWQVAADANTAGEVYPDQSLYPANAGPELARRINRALRRADQVEHAEGGATRDWFAFRCDSHTVNWELVRAGCGIGFGQAGVAQADPEIEEIPIDVNLPVLPVWLATHQALRHSPRIAMVWDALAEGMAPHLV